MRRWGQAARQRRARPCGLMIAALVAVLPGMATATDHLVGTWAIQVHDGTAIGDYGQITIRRDGDGLVGDMTFTDSSAEVSSTQVCQVWPGTPTIAIYCTVITPDPGGYAPDNLSIRMVAPDRMEGVMISVTTGRATLTRSEAPTS